MKILHLAFKQAAKITSRKMILKFVTILDGKIVDTFQVKQIQNAA